MTATTNHYQPQGTKTMRLKIASAEVRLTVICTGRNDENADIDNPRGEFYESVHIIEAYSEKGEVFVLTGFSCTSEDKGSKLVQRIIETGSIDENLWHFSRIMYGAEGWNEQELQNEINDARRAGELHPMDR